jgi:HicB-like protein involved in pilus formation
MATGDNPDEQRHFGGRVLVRMPASLHQELVEAAKADGVSLNQFVWALLASAMRWRQSADAGGGVSSELPPGHDRVSREEWPRIWRNTWG